MVIKRAVFIITLFVSILTWMLQPSPALAACIDPPITGCIGGNSVTCSAVSSGGVSASACCATSAECTTFRNNFLSGNATSNPVVGGGTIQAWNPEGSCPNGIDTALGCLPYKSEDGKFTEALLTFLAGLTGAISLIVMLMATIQIMTAGGNPEQVKHGKELLTGAITGLLFIIFSVTLLRMIAGDIIQLEGF